MATLYPVPPASPPRAAVLHARVAALAAAVGLAAHLYMAMSGGWMAALSLVMASACAPCAWKMLRSPSLATARMLVAMSLGMAVLHGALLLVAGPAVGHSHGAGAIVTATLPTAHAAAALAVMGADFASALLAASWIRRRAAVR